MRIIKYLLIVTIISLIGVVIGLVLMNLSPIISLTFLKWGSVDLPLGLWLFIFFLGGTIFSIIWQTTNYWQQQTLQRRIKQLQAKINQETTINQPIFTDDWDDEEYISEELPQKKPPLQQPIYQDDLIEEEEEEYLQEEPTKNYPSKDKVYDADYRVIKPPTKPPEYDDYSSDEDDSNDWGFDFDRDEDFQRKRRR